MNNFYPKWEVVEKLAPSVEFAKYDIIYNRIVYLENKKYYEYVQHKLKVVIREKPSWMTERFYRFMLNQLLYLEAFPPKEVYVNDLDNPSDPYND